MVSCLFCRKKLFFESNLGSSFAKSAVSVYRCTRCKIWIKVTKLILQSGETMHDVKTIPFKKGDEVGVKVPMKLIRK